MTHETLVNNAKELNSRLENFKEYTLIIQNFVVEEIAIDTVILFDKSDNCTNVTFDQIAEYLDQFDNDWDYEYMLNDYIHHLQEENQLADIAACADFWHTEAEKMEDAQKWANYQAARFTNKMPENPNQASDYPQPIEIR
jgi:coenzyme F420-reducing hydrogenase alpha subunit